jgi:hypothetical protein
VTYNTIDGNIASDSGSGIYNDDRGNSYLAIGDCIIWNDGDDLANCSASYSCIKDGDPGEGNTSDDPLFVTGPFGDYYLDPSSPCVDAGSMSAYSAGIADKTTRTDGRPDTGIVDIGYHYPTLFMLPEVWVSTPSNTYSHGDTLEIVFEAVNLNRYSYPVDVYAGVITSDGAIWTIDAAWVWSNAVSPWFASLELSPNLHFGPTTLLTLPIPSGSPPISDTGTYCAAAAFAHVGTTTFIGEPSVSAFELVAED